MSLNVTTATPSLTLQLRYLPGNSNQFFLHQIFFLAFDFFRFCVVFRFFHPCHNGQWPPTLKDFYTRSYPLHYFLILILIQFCWNVIDMEFMGKTNITCSFHFWIKRTPFWNCRYHQEKIRVIKWSCTISSTRTCISQQWIIQPALVYEIVMLSPSQAGGYPIQTWTVCKRRMICIRIQISNV